MLGRLSLDLSGDHRRVKPGHVERGQSNSNASRQQVAEHPTIEVFHHEYASSKDSAVTLVNSIVPLKNVLTDFFASFNFLSFFIDYDQRRPFIVTYGFAFCDRRNNEVNHKHWDFFCCIGLCHF
jgi:hypothetical protein